eukprot:scaffold11543_cov128-Isochrysis_galbana.AAC.2
MSMRFPLSHLQRHPATWTWRPRPRLARAEEAANKDDVAAACVRVCVRSHAPKGRLCLASEFLIVTARQPGPRQLP